MHKKTLRLATGEGLSDPELRIATFRAREEEGKVYVLLPPASALAGLESACSEPCRA